MRPRVETMALNVYGLCCRKIFFVLFEEMNIIVQSCSVPLSLLGGGVYSLLVSV